MIIKLIYEKKAKNGKNGTVAAEGRADDGFATTTVMVGAGSS